MAVFSAHAGSAEDVFELTPKEFLNMVLGMMDKIGLLILGLFGWTVIKRILYKKGSCINKILFVTDIILCHIIGGVLIYFAVKYSVDFFAIVIALFLIFFNYHSYKAWRSNPSYPYRPEIS